MSYRIEVARSAEKELARLPRSVAERVGQKIDSSAESPRPAGFLRLSGNRDLWRVRVGDYRVLYRIDDVVQVVGVEAVRHQRDAYD